MRVGAAEPRARSVLNRIADALASEVLFWFLAAAFAGIFLWSFAAGAALVGLVILVGGAWYKWEPNRAAYRCNACQTVLTYQEVIPPHERAG